MRLSKTILLLLIFFSFSSLRAQETIEELISDEYIPAFCECLEANKDANLGKLVTTTSVRCGLKFAMDNMKRMQQVMSEKFPDMTKEEQYKAGKLLGGDIKKTQAARLVRECETYRLALIAYKDDFAGVNSKNEAKTELKRVKKMLDAGTDRQNAVAYLKMAVLLEKRGKRKAAIQAYNNSIKLNSTAIAEGFKAVLEMR